MKPYPFSGRCQGGPRTGPAVAWTLTVEPLLASITELWPGSIYVTWKTKKLECEYQTEKRHLNLCFWAHNYLIILNASIATFRNQLRQWFRFSCFKRCDFGMEFVYGHVHHLSSKRNYPKIDREQLNKNRGPSLIDISYPKTMLALEKKALLIVKLWFWISFDHTI